MKNAIVVIASSFARKFDLASLKSSADELDIDKLKNVQTNFKNFENKEDKLHIGKLETTQVDSSKLSNVVKKNIVKKDVYNAKVKNIVHKIPDITNWATKTNLNVKML